ncbi:unnamed protein product, partial [marine sediment metagenome]
LRIEGWVFLPKPEQPKIVALGIDHSRALSCFRHQLNSVFEEKSIGAGETRRFVPHLTIARATSLFNGATIKSIRFTADFTVKNIDLMKSELHPSGASYSIIQTFSLFQK